MMKRHRALSALGLNVRKHREIRRFTQESLAERADLDPTYISGIERGVRNPSVLSLVRVGAALGVTVAELCESIDS